MSKLLLHTCCAPCLTYIYYDLFEFHEIYKENDEVDIYWYNPNIQPKVEFDKRLNALKDFCNNKDLNLIVNDEYNLNEFVKGRINDGCNFCYGMRLRKAFDYAIQNGYDKVMTTLCISPYQNQAKIKEIIDNLAKEYNINGVYLDYTSKFREGQNMARKENIYMQRYCGCVFSLDKGKIKGIL